MHPKSHIWNEPTGTYDFREKSNEVFALPIGIETRYSYIYR